jgi:MFS family permease
VTRSLQGVAAAVLIPNATAYVRRAVDLDRLGTSVGSVGAFAAAGAAIGPVVGGLLLAAGDWRLLFLANLPVAAVALLLVLALPPERRTTGAAPRIELPSIVALAAAFGGLALLGTAARSGSALLAASAALLAVAGTAAYGAWFRLRRAGVVDLGLFTSRAYASAAAMTCLTNLVMYTTLISVPVYLRDERGTGTAAIGAILFAMSATMAALSWLGGRFADVAGARAVLIGGAAAITVASASVGVALEFASLPLLVVALAALGVGMGVSTPVQQTAGLAAWPASVAGSAAGTLSLMRYVGSVAGASIAAAVLGASPARGHFEVLLLLLTAVAIANLLVAMLPVRPRPSEMAASPA